MEKYMYDEKGNQQKPEEIKERWRESLEANQITKEKSNKF